MKLILANLIGFAIIWTGLATYYAGASSSPAECASLDVSACDLDGDGAISILDLNLMAQHFGQQVTPNPCVVHEFFPTAQSVYTWDGTPIADIIGRDLVPSDHPLLPAIEAGTRVSLRPCADSTNVTSGILGGP